MTRKDFVLIARVLSDTRPDDPPGRLMHARVVLGFADALGRANPNFKKGRFLDAASQ